MLSRCLLNKAVYLQQSSKYILVAGLHKKTDVTDGVLEEGNPKYLKLVYDNDTLSEGKKKKR